MVCCEAMERRKASRTGSAELEAKGKQLELQSENLRRVDREAERRSGGVLGAKGHPCEGAFEDEVAAYPNSASAEELQSQGRA